MIYTVTLNPSLDCFMDTDTVPGTVNRARSQKILPSGKGINVSRVLCMLGGETVALGFSSGHTGDALAAMLESDGIPHALTKTGSGETRINVKLAGTGDEPDTELNASGTPVTDRDADALCASLSRAGEGDVCVFSGSVPPGFGKTELRRVLEAVSPYAGLVCDLAGELLLESLEFSPLLVKPNEHELAALFPETEIEKAAETLLLRGAKNVLVSLGARGAYYTGEGGEGYIGSPALTPAPGVRSAVGCGDSAVAGWLCGYGLAGDGALALAKKFCPDTSSREERAARFAAYVGTAAYAYGFGVTIK